MILKVSDFKDIKDYDDTDILLTWLTGNARKLKPVKQLSEFQYQILGVQSPAWEFSPVGDFYMFTLRMNRVPNVFHRTMQRICCSVMNAIHRPKKLMNYGW